MKTTFERLQAIVAHDYKLETDKVNADSSLESLGIDSLGVAELLFNIEDEFQVVLPAEPVPGLVTLGDVARFIDTLTSAKPASAVGASASSEGDSLPLT